MSIVTFGVFRERKICWATEDPQPAACRTHLSAMSAGRMGILGRGWPVAALTAAPMAAEEEMVGGSPMPLAP